MQVTQNELELGFRKLKEVFERKGVDFKKFIFEIEHVGENTDDEKDPDEIRLSASEEAMFAIPLMREEFMQRINEGYLDDIELAEKIAIGCQQVARSVCFVHYWAFNALWLAFHSQLDANKPTIKLLQEQHAADAEAREAKIVELEQNQEKEAQRVAKEREEAQIAADLSKQEVENKLAEREEELKEQVKMRE